VVPVSDRTQVEVVKFPQMVVDSPVQAVYEIRNDPVPLKIHLEGEGSELYEGDFLAIIQDPVGGSTDVTLRPTNGSYQGEFIPKSDGLHQVFFKPVNGYYLGQPYPYQVESGFDARIVANLIVTGIDLGLGEAKGKQRFEIEEAREGIPVTITIESRSAEPQTVQPRLEQMPGFSLIEQKAITVAPGGKTTTTIHLVGDEQINFGKWDGRLVLTAAGLVDILNNQPEIQFEVFQPAVSIASQVISQVSEESCWTWAPVKLVLATTSNSVRSEKIIPQLLGLANVTLEPETLEVPPGNGQLEVLLISEQQLTPGDYQAKIRYTGREGLKITPETSQELAFRIEPVWVNCRRPLIIFGLLGLFLVILAGVIIRKNIIKNRPALVTGTLTYWPATSPRDEAPPVDLTEKHAIEITIGSSPECTISLTDDSIEEVHARISMEKVEGEEPRIIITPLGLITVNYREISQPVQLESNVNYEIGKYVFQYVPDQ
jgi:hypothetical protein